MGSRSNRIACVSRVWIRLFGFRFLKLRSFRGFEFSLVDIQANTESCNAFCQSALDGIVYVSSIDFVHRHGIVAVVHDGEGFHALDTESRHRAFDEPESVHVPHGVSKRVLDDTEVRVWVDFEHCPPSDRPIQIGELDGDRFTAFRVVFDFLPINVLWLRSPRGSLGELLG